MTTLITMTLWDPEYFVDLWLAQGLNQISTLGNYLSWLSLYSEDSMNIVD